MAARTALLLSCVLAFFCGICGAYNLSTPELTQRETFPDDALQFNYPESSAYANSSAGTIYSMDLVTNPILGTLPAPGLSGKVDIFQPCSIKVPHVHPRATKFSYVIEGTLEAGIAEEDTGRILTFNVSTGQAIVIPQGLIHYMKNDDCTTPLKMVTVFNNVDSGELVLLEKILAFPTPTALVSTGLDMDALTKLRNSVPKGPGDMRTDTVCQKFCQAAMSPTVPATTAGK